MEMQAIAGTYGIERGSVLAIAAGADAICVGGGLADDETVLPPARRPGRAVRDGELPEERLADAAAGSGRWPAGRRSGHGADRVADRRAARRRRPRGGPPRPAADRRRALRPRSRDRPYVAAFTPVANIAVGDETPWGVAAELVRLLPGTATGTFAGDAAGEAALAEAGPNRVVAVVRDEHRHPWMSAALDTLLTARPDTIVVEMGVPQAPPPGRPPHRHPRRGPGLRPGRGGGHRGAQ